jgi:6-phosphofructokinase 1
VLVVEVMGRHAGHIALWSGIAGGATIVLIPERPFNIEEVCAALRHRHENRNRYASIVVVAEGALPAAGGDFVTQTGELDAFGHVRLGGIGDALAREIEERTGYESRAVVLGHVQRGGTPTAFDRVLSTRFGIAAIDAVHDGAFGQMVALRAGEIVRVSLEDATGELKLVSEDLYDVAKVFFG